MLTILIKAYCVNVVVDIKPIYLKKRYLFQNKFYYLVKIFFSGAETNSIFNLSFKLCYRADSIWYVIFGP